MGVKRRRGIGLRKWLILALKDYANNENISHTAAVNRILRGSLAPLHEYERHKEGGDNSKQGVSMREELWLALKDYARQRGKSESDTRVACNILVGKIGPIPEPCIKEGQRLARLREEGRGAGAVEFRPKAESGIKKSALMDIAQIGPEPSQEGIILEERGDVLARTDDRGRALSSGVPMVEKSLERKINPDDDSYGGVFNL